MKSIKNIVSIIFLSGLFACSKEVTTTESLSANVQSSSVVQDSFYIGKSYQGGIIFYIDSTGQHGLIAAVKDLKGLFVWSNPSNVLVRNTQSVVGSGKTNTNKIVRFFGDSTDYAALGCVTYKRQEYRDWYLPSIDELTLLMAQKEIVGGFKGNYYWSSTETSYFQAWYVSNFNNAVEYTIKNDPFYVRPIRSF